MRKIQLDIPESVELSEFDFYMIIASKLYADAKLSAGQAAGIAGISKRTFIELVGKYGVSILDDSISDLHSDIRNA